MSLNHMAETLLASETFMKKAAFRLYENKTRAVSDVNPPKRKSKKRKIPMSRFMWRLTFYQLVMDEDYFSPQKENSCHSPC